METRSKLLSECLTLCDVKININGWIGIIIDSDNVSDYCSSDLHNTSNEITSSFQDLMIFLCINYIDNKTLLLRETETEDGIIRRLISTKLWCRRCEKFSILTTLFLKKNLNGEIIQASFFVIPIIQLTIQSINVLINATISCQDRNFLRESLYSIVRMHRLVTTEQLLSRKSKLILNFINNNVSTK